ncbi:MAG TPA: SRPBCC family protein [Candidatus Limnocylindrales bacterium]
MDGSVRHTDQGFELRFERLLYHPVDKVWAALTEPERRAEWFFAGRLDLRPEGTVDLADAVHGITGKVLAIEPPWLLEFSWVSGDSPEESVVRFELSKANQGCSLVFTHTVPASANRMSLAAGWHCHLDALPLALNGEQTEWPEGKWRQQLEHYQRILSN